MRNLPGFSPMRLTLVLTLGFFFLSVVLAFLVTRSAGNDAQTASNTTSSGGKRVKVVIAGTNDAVEEQTDGGIAGRRHVQGDWRDHGQGVGSPPTAGSAP